MIEIAYQVSLGLMTNGFTLHETLAIAVARRKTAPVEVTGPKREDTMVTRFLVDREAKVDVPDYMEPVARDRPAFLQSLGSQFFFTSMDLTAVCAGEKNQDSSSLVAIDVRSWNHESVGQTEELNQRKCTNRMAFGRVASKMRGHMQHHPCRLSFCSAPIRKDLG
jgi:hypothetical protein